MARCEETNHVLNSFPDDRAKMEVTEKLPPPIFMKGVGCFLGYAWLYMKFIKDFSKITRPMCSLPEKEMKFVFDE